MDTVEELMAAGMPKYSAKQKAESQKKHIGTMSGCLRIDDINFLPGKKASDIKLICVKCGREYHKEFNGNSNKWSELRRHCSCENSHANGDNNSSINADPSWIGKVFGDFEVIEFFQEKKKAKSGSRIKWKVRCVKCGYEKTIIPGQLRSEKVPRHRICDCEKRKRDAELIAMGLKRKPATSVEEKQREYTGKKINRLTIDKIYYKTTGNQKTVFCDCTCECGKKVTSQFWHVLNNAVKSCGCYSADYAKMQSEAAKDSNAISKSPLYATWNGMKQRCYNKNNHNYSNYGARGILVCDEWKNNFLSFENWAIKNGWYPNCGLTLDRIDVNGNYSPNNCRWASPSVQLVNRRPYRKKKYVINGIEKTKKQWCDEYGIWEPTVDYRMKHMAMSLEEALTAEKRTVGNHTRRPRDTTLEEMMELEALNKNTSYIEANLYMAFIRLSDEYILEPQYQVDNYRCDFHVAATDILVECDGKDAHFKTQELINNDYKRERHLKARGYTVIRYTGSEINADPDAIARDLLEMIKIITGRKEYAYNG